MSRNGEAETQQKATRTTHTNALKRRRPVRSHGPAAANSTAIIGGGLIGLSIAWDLARGGRRVTIYEKNRIGGEASWAAAGMLSPGGEVEGQSALASLAIESRNLYTQFVRELEQASGLAIDYQECGGLDLAYSPEDLQALEVRARAQESDWLFPSHPVPTAGNTDGTAKPRASPPIALRIRSRRLSDQR